MGIQWSCRSEGLGAEELRKCSVDFVGCPLLWVVPGRDDDVLHDIGGILRPGSARVEILLNVTLVAPEHEHGALNCIPGIKVCGIHDEI